MQQDKQCYKFQIDDETECFATWFAEYLFFFQYHLFEKDRTQERYQGTCRTMYSQTIAGDINNKPCCETYQQFRPARKCLRKGDKEQDVETGMAKTKEVQVVDEQQLQQNEHYETQNIISPYSSKFLISSRLFRCRILTFCNLLKSVDKATVI